MAHLSSYRSNRVRKMRVWVVFSVSSSLRKAKIKTFLKSFQKRGDMPHPVTFKRASMPGYMEAQSDGKSSPARQDRNIKILQHDTTNDASLFSEVLTKSATLLYKHVRRGN